MESLLSPAVRAFLITNCMWKSVCVCAGGGAASTSLHIHVYRPDLWVLMIIKFSPLSDQRSVLNLGANRTQLIMSPNWKPVAAAPICPTSCVPPGEPQPTHVGTRSLSSGRAQNVDVQKDKEKSCAFCPLFSLIVFHQLHRKENNFCDITHIRNTSHSIPIGETK